MAYSVVVSSKTSKRPSPLQPPRQSYPLRLKSAPNPPIAASSPKNKSLAESGVMDAGYYRPGSPRYRIATPARASTGTFGDPYHEPTYYERTSPRTSAERLTVPVHHGHHHGYAPSSTSSSSRSGSHKYDSYSGRPRRNTLTEADERPHRPLVKELAPKTLPIHVPGGHRHHHSLQEPPSGYMSRSFDGRPDPIITHGPPRHHSRIYSIDDNSRKAELIADREFIEPRRRDDDPRGYSITSGGKPYYYDKSFGRPKDLDEDGYSYTDPASMYRDTEPVWRRTRAASTERSRPISMTLDRGPRISSREPGPPPSTRGFDKINASSHRHHHYRSPSIERSRDVPKYDPYPEGGLGRSSSTRHKAPAVHQEPREHRRDTYDDEYGRRHRDVGSTKVSSERFEDRDVASRGFGIAPGHPSLAQDDDALDRQPVWSAAQEVDPPRRLPSDDRSGHYHSVDRADARMPEPHIPRDRDVPSAYDERPRERERDRDRDRDRERREKEPGDRSHIPSSALATAAGAAAATYGTAAALTSRERDREVERDRERREEWDERDRRDRPDERRDIREPDRRHEPEEEGRLHLAAAAYASTQESEQRTRGRRSDEGEGAYRTRERRSDDDERDRRARGSPSSDASGEARTRYYVEREAARESERRRESKEATRDPDEEYRRRIQLEAERSGRGNRELESDRDVDRRRHRGEREVSRDPNADSRSSPSQELTRSRHDERPGSVLDRDLVQEPEPLNARDADHAQPSKTVQIVAPPKDPQPQPKSILRKPTEKFPEDPDPIREGVAPHKSALKGKDIPPGARWTKIDRRLVNPEALEEAKERFEERMDCVIVLRVLTKQEIQKLADRTREIREARGGYWASRAEDNYTDHDVEEEFDRYDRRNRESRRHRSHRDDEHRDRRGDYDDSDDDDDVGRRGRDRARDRPRMIEG
ncbi:uncharacterized protein EI97DRAFT_504288 [Westerdykella ornata]|uniref:DUF8035 domain-containing protein n=1 Tax=Westerdykella ornata TaxID=318751 RepID=A0A6A6J857_WESOR|nr:uncharacterized protein EI97DRAFT_504288 [Westerdykella ornata]KAF2272384.1 hypothetical protein EI97DRAFT_504288 [Westerdykella ornata]